jgi:hypothetical protein
MGEDEDEVIFGDRCKFFYRPEKARLHYPRRDVIFLKIIKTDMLGINLERLRLPKSYRDTVGKLYKDEALKKFLFDEEKLSQLLEERKGEERKDLANILMNANGHNKKLLLEIMDRHGIKAMGTLYKIISNSFGTYTLKNIKGGWDGVTKADA